MAFTKNPFTGVLDFYEDSKDLKLSNLYLKIDQTTPQNVINDAPQFDEGIIIKANKRVYLDGL